MKCRYWTDAELALLRDTYADNATSEIAAKLNRPTHAVYNKAATLGLRKSVDYLASPSACRLRRGANIGAACRFQKGHVTWNAGMKGWTAGGRSAETRFKKGQWPVNKDPEFYVLGALRVADGYIQIRTSFRPGASGWSQLHRVLWEDVHGPVPNGYALCFKNHDPLDVELDNLELLSRADLMRRNTVHNLPPALKSTIRVLGVLKRKLREKQDRGSAQSSIRDAGGPS